LQFISLVYFCTKNRKLYNKHLKQFYIDELESIKEEQAKYLQVLVDNNHLDLVHSADDLKNKGFQEITRQNEGKTIVYFLKSFGHDVLIYKQTRQGEDFYRVYDSADCSEKENANLDDVLNIILDYYSQDYLA
jgi:hypothetical protein